MEPEWSKSMYDQQNDSLIYSPDREKILKSQNHIESG